LAQFLIHLLASAVAVLVAQAIFPNLIQVAGLAEALLFAVVLGLLNALVRPILLLLTCPLNLLTLGLFVFVVNAIVFWMASWFPVGVTVSGFLGAFVGALAVSIVSALASGLLAGQNRG
jgi:putative membrane protein